MNQEMTPAKTLESFTLSSLVPAKSDLTPIQAAAADLVCAFDDVWRVMPLEARDFMLRCFSSFGMPVGYPKLPFWAERAALHVLTIVYPTLRKCDFRNPTIEDLGRFVGHLSALVSHARQDSEVFQRMSEKTSAEIRAFLFRIEAPVHALATEALKLPPSEAGLFLKGMNHAFSRTFDTFGMPFGWNTNSPIMLGLCLGWRYIATKAPTLAILHRQLAEMFGKQEVGSEDRVKKICQRIGLRFSGSKKSDSQGTSIESAVPSSPGSIPDR